MASIAFLKSGLNKRGGLEKYCLRLAEAYAKAGYKVYLLTTDCPEGLPLNFDAEVVNLGSRIPLSFLHLLIFDWRCRRWLASHAVDCVFGFDRNFCRQNMYRAGNGVHKAYLERRSKDASWLKRMSFCFNPLHRLILAMERSTFESKDLDVLITNSHLVRSEVLRFYPQVDPAKVKVVHNGVEWTEFQKPFYETIEQRELFFQKHNLDSSRYQFLFVGNEYERKGLPDLLHALSKLQRRDWNLLVVGKERNQRKFEQLRDALGLKENVFFFGLRKDVMHFYQASDCLVVASRYDPFANVTVEALAMGLYVISSDQNGGSEILTDPAVGVVYHNQEELEASLATAFSHVKTMSASQERRQFVRLCDFPNQIQKIIGWRSLQ